MREMFKKFILLLIVIFPGVVYSANLETGGVSKNISENNSPIIIGVPIPLSGDLKPFGILMKNSFEMAKKDINKAGGIKGRLLKLVYGDDQGKASVGEQVIEKLVTESKAIMLVGGYGSNSTYAMARIAQRLNVPFLICTASADKITKMGWKNIYRLNPPVSEYTKGLEDFWIKELKPKSIAIIHEYGMYGTSSALRVIEFCRDNSIEIEEVIGYVEEKASSTYFRPMIAPLTEEPPDVIYMVSYLKDAVCLVKELRKIKIKSLLCGGAGGFTLNKFIELAGDSANNVLTATLWTPNLRYPGAKEYYERYTELYSTPPDYHGVEAYSALILASDSLGRAKNYSSKGIRTALDKTFMVTPFGPVKFYNYKDFERQNSTQTQVLKIINRKFECIWPLHLCTVEQNSGNIGK